MTKIAIVGSMSTDFVVTTDIIPVEGETVIGSSFNTFLGGKGANQAVASSRAGAKTFMLGAVGDDSYGQAIVNNLESNDVQVGMMAVVEGVSSGSAHIQVKDGDNRIVIVPGSNYCLTKELLLPYLKELQTMDLIVMQNEIPFETIEYVINQCDEWKIPVLFNPAPAILLSNELLEKVAYLTPNETEFAVMFPNEELDDVLKKYPNRLIVTLGSKGAVYHDGKQVVYVPADKVTVDKIIDTTGAGDTFNGYFASCIMQEYSLFESIQLANKAAGLSIQKAGAQQGIPLMADVLAKINS
ncbi:ribokinase [Vagococcus sp.]|uniref:ribokinase n=1 Tax=Vagococcus sp. TaxID=1933889 RepID=UPI003F9E8543